MKKNILKYICAGFVICGMASCLNLDPKDSLGDNLVWSKADNFQLFANQFYGWTRDMGSGTDYQNGVADGAHSDYRSDLICTNSVNTYSQGTNAIPEKDGNFTSIYKRIYYTNLLLKNAEGFANQASIATPMGEAYWFRAYLHFELVQLYGDAQILTEPLDIDNGQLYGSRNPRGEVIDQCIEDLMLATELLPETPAEEGRLCRDAAQAMLSRVALYEGTWQKFHGGNTVRATELLTIAKNAADEVIRAGHYSLFYNAALVNPAINNINQSYRYMFILEDAGQCNPAGLLKAANTEYILSHRHRDTDKLSINITHGLLSNVCYITRKMANMYLCSDGLPIGKSPLFKGYTGATDEFQNRDARMDNTMLQHNEPYWNNDSKWRTSWTDADLDNCLTGNARSNSGYQNQKWGVEREVADYYESMDYPVIRYAEVLLNYAEAAYELNENISDSDLDKSLNLVRRRINPSMPKLSNSFCSANGLTMRDEIRRERTVELFLEGFRIDDLKRWKTAETEMPQDQLGVKMTGTWFETNWAAQARPLNSDGCIVMYNGRTWAQKNYLYPLPQDQRQLNANLSQNPGWE